MTPHPFFNANVTHTLRTSCLSALTRCTVLRKLDLSHSTSVSLRDLFQVLGDGGNLEDLSLSPCSNPGTGLQWELIYAWPPKLQNLRLAGSFNDAHPLSSERFPTQLTHLTIGSCPGLSSEAVYSWLITTDKTLKYLKIADWLPSCNQDFLDEILVFAPSLRHLYLSHRFFTSCFGKHIADAGAGQPLVNMDLLPLETLELDGEDIDHDRDDPDLDVSPGEMLLLAVRLPHLRILKVHENYGWLFSRNALYYLACIRWRMIDQAQFRGDQRETRLEITPTGLAIEIRYVVNRRVECVWACAYLFYQSSPRDHIQFLRNMESYTQPLEMSCTP